MDLKKIYSIYTEHPVVTTDSRTCPPDSMFFALKGENFDGNQYAAAALQRGCAYAVVDDESVVRDGDGRYVLVDDVLLTLQQLALHHRRTLSIPIIGITGTNGKTTTKELSAAVLSKRYNVLYTEGNLNNAIGVPRTLLRLTKNHDVAIIEMGASHVGDIKELVDMVEPTHGLITNVGRAHLQGFGSFEGVVRTKCELYDFLRQHRSKAFVNPVDEILMRQAAGVRSVPYQKGLLLDCNPYLHFDWNNHNVQTQLIGAYNLDNALAAITIGVHFGVQENDICDALSHYVPSNNRSQLLRTPYNTLVVDAYNANPTSMHAAIDNFSRMQAQRKMVILGDMGELGSVSEREHQNIVDMLTKADLEQVWLVGKNFAQTVCPPHFRHFADVAAVREELAVHRLRHFTILIKGSHSTHLYELTKAEI